MKTVIINVLTYRSLYGTERMVVPLLNKLHSYLSHPVLLQQVLCYAFRSNNRETTVSVLDIVHICSIAQRGVSTPVGACGMKIFSVGNVRVLVWNSCFGSVISETTFYRKLLMIYRIIKNFTIIHPHITCLYI
jgi:hypothetical protein